MRRHYGRNRELSVLFEHFSTPPPNHPTTTQSPQSFLAEPFPFLHFFSKNECITDERRMKLKEYERNRKNIKRLTIAIAPENQKPILAQKHLHTKHAQTTEEFSETRYKTLNSQKSHRHLEIYAT